MGGADNDVSTLYCDDDVDDEDAYTSVLDTPDPCLSDLLQSHIEHGINRSSHPSKCLIFAQFTRSLDAVENLVFKTLMPTLQYCRLDGSIAPSKRMDIVNSFQNDPSVQVLLATTRVGGVGLNLTSASTVIFLEIDFNPYADAQAQDRCMRIGQTQQVCVYKIITQDSIEESILTLQDKKIQVTEAIVNNENSTIYSMGTERLLDLFDVKGPDGPELRDSLEFEYDLEGIVEKCADDYVNLSVNTFKSTFLR
jgi:TATA-binding protein-associated factor